MDPYLEGHLWPDFQHSLAVGISRYLMPYLNPRYVARLKVELFRDTEPEVEMGITYPTVKTPAALAPP
jgi:hypothetical protein